MSEAYQGLITITDLTDNKACEIRGVNVFKYNENGEILPASSSITLTAMLSDNISGSNWQYKNSLGNFVDFSPITTGDTITINHTDDIFINDIATIKKLTSDESVFDIFTITKIRDGSPGDALINASLSNDNQTIPCDGNGIPFESSFPISSKITIYEGAEDITSEYSISVTIQSDSGVPRLIGSISGDTFTATSWNALSQSYYTATVTFTCTRTGYSSINKVLTLSKITTGSSPNYYELTYDILATNKNISNIFNPSSVTLRANHINGELIEDYQGYLKLYRVKLDGTQETITTSNMSSDDAGGYKYTYTFSQTLDINTKYLLAELYKTNDVGDCLDKQSIIVTSDGESGSYLVSTSIWYGKSESNTSYADTIWYSWSGGNIPVTTDTTKPYLWTKTEYIYSDTSLNKTTYNVSVTNDSIKVGGRNYALSTGEEISITGTNVDNQTVKLYDLSLSIDELNTIEPNCLLISFDMSISNGITGESGTPSISVGQYDSPWNRISVTETEIGTYHKQIIIPNRTWTTPIVGCGLNYINTNCTIIFSNFKLENGNKYTDWTPAVEDVGDNVITQIQNLTPKIFYAYSSSSNGGDNFSITNSDLQYVGEYMSMSSEQSLNYSDYTWGINPSWASKYADNYIMPISDGGIKLISPDVSTYAGLTPIALAFYLGDIEQARIGYDSDLMNAYGVVASNIFAYGNGSGVRFDNSEQAVMAGGGRGRFTWEVRQNGHFSLKRL